MITKITLFRSQLYLQEREFIKSHEELRQATVDQNAEKYIVEENLSVPQI